MRSHLRANLWLFGLSLLLCCVVYPGVLLLIGRFAFPSQAEGSLIFDRDGKAIGSRLIAQPFSQEEFFQPRPSAASYNGAASGASNWGANNPLLRDRVARQLGPIARYRGGPKAHQLVGPDIESWFRQNRFQQKPGIVAQWAQGHPSIARNWVTSDTVNSDGVLTWQAAHPTEVARWIAENPDTPEPKPEDLAVPYLVDFGKSHPGAFPVVAEHKSADGSIEKTLVPTSSGPEIQATFFDMWRQDHPTEQLETVPADMVMASGSGLDPDITLKNALSQLDRVAAKWASETRRNPTQIREEVESLLHQMARAPFGGLAGVELINVLEVNLALEQRYRPAPYEPEVAVAPGVAPGYCGSC
jgi:potassium-transporting ATPase KdpC subunit